MPHEHNYAGSWDSEFFSGLRFCATLQLRTPLRALLRHGERHIDPNVPPPTISEEGWEGVWVLETKTWKELGANMPEMPESSIASAIGPILASKYLPFLIAIRTTYEQPIPEDSRIAQLRVELSEWKPYVKKHGGINTIIQYLFPSRKPVKSIKRR